MQTMDLCRCEWQVKGLAPGTAFEPNACEQYFRQEDKDTGVFCVSAMPQDVHKILMENGVIENPNIHGNSEEIQWISDDDWLYRTAFTLADRSFSHYRLFFCGLDTYADVYLNGVLIGSTNDYYLPHAFDVTDILREENILLVHVKAPLPILKAVQVRSDLEEKIELHVRGRVAYSGYIDYSGPKPCLILMGIYDKVLLEGWNERIDYTDINSRVDLETNTAVVSVKVSCDGGDLVHTDVISPEGETLKRLTGKPGEELTAVIEKPRLWWPASMGDQPLYTVCTTLYAGGKEVDRQEKKIGLRDLKLVGDFDFRMNGRPLKLWGACIAPLDSSTACYSEERMERIMELAELAHFNCFRAWGEDGVVPDAFYDECDRRGIMVWQDFKAGNAVYDTDDALEELLRLEAEHMVKRLKHRPSILLWSGGNESLMRRDFMFPDEIYPNKKIFMEIFPQVCHQWDPGRYYHPSSPFGGAFENDPLKGDTHGYTHLWYVPGYMYPVFLSENCRVSTPALRTMQVMMKPEDLWPEGYNGLQRKNSPYPWPLEWNKYNSNIGFVKLGEIERFYDAEDLPSMLYRIGWGHGYYIRSRVERYRRGYPVEQADKGERITKGHLLWKFNNSCNHIFFGVIDYFCEPYIPYYALKRAYSPVLVSFDVNNFIYVWLTNDTVEDYQGTLFVELFDPFANKVVQSFEEPFSLKADESKPICDLNRFRQFSNNYILHAYAVDETGKRLGESIDYCQLERQMRFPEDGTIKMKRRGDTLYLTTDRYARSVELLGYGEDGDPFGWLFEDNYFDMLPGDTKKVRIIRGRDKGRITAKGYYFTGITEIKLD